MKKALILVSLCLFSFAVFSQDIKNSIQGQDIWGAWMVPGTTTAWLVDGIPETARLWDYSKNEVLASFELKENVKDINVLEDGALAYISHHDKNEYIILDKDGERKKIRFKPNAPSYYLHPNGKYFFGSTFEGFVTYTIKGSKVSSSKLNESITGYSSDFVETSSESTIFRYTKEAIQKMEIDDDGNLSVSRAYDLGHLLLNRSKDQFVLVTTTSFKKYELNALEATDSSKNTKNIDFTSGIYDDENGVILCSNDNRVDKFDLSKKDFISSQELKIEKLYFEDRSGNMVIGFSDTEEKFYVFEI